MIKRDEIADPNSCLNRASDDEPIFVLRARDVQAPGLLLAWANRRAYLIGLGEKPRSDMRLVEEAAGLAERMALWRTENVK